MEFKKGFLKAIWETAIFVIIVAVCSASANGAGYPQKGAVGKTAMVSTTDKETTRIVLDLLQKGWNAVDAAIATQFLMGVYEPGMTGMGGFGFEATIFWAKDDEITEFLAFGRAPGKARADMFKIVPGIEPGLPAKVAERANVVGYKAPLVPPILRGLYELNKKYGTRPWKELVEPAIKVAEEGFEASPKYVQDLKDAEAILKMFPASTELYLPGGKTPEKGQKIFNKDLAKTMRMIAEKGPDVFYKGEIAEAITGYLQKNGGIIHREDFSVPRLEERKLSSFTYRGHRILINPSLGGSALAEIMNILSNYDLRRMGYQTADSLHVIIEAMKLAFTDRYVYAADPEAVPTALDGMMAWSYGRDQAKRIDLKKAQTFTPGNPWPYQSIGRDLVKSAKQQNIKMAMGPGAHETTQYDIVDQYGNIVVMITSLRSNFGSGVTAPGTGFVLNNGMALFDPRPGTNNSIAPFKAPLANGAQVIVLNKDEKPILAMGAPGGRAIITATALVLSNMLDYGMSLQDAIDAARIHSEAVGKIVLMESRIPEAIRKELERRGHEIKVLPDFHPIAFARMQAIQLNPETGLLFGSSDPRVNGAAMGY